MYTDFCFGRKSSVVQSVETRRIPVPVSNILQRRTLKGLEIWSTDFDPPRPEETGVAFCAVAVVALPLRFDCREIIDRFGGRTVGGEGTRLQHSVWSSSYATSRRKAPGSVRLQPSAQVLEIEAALRDPNNDRPDWAESLQAVQAQEK